MNASSGETGPLGRAYDWVDERLKINVLVEYMKSKVVPVHGHSAFYYFGGVSLFLFIKRANL